METGYRSAVYIILYYSLVFVFEKSAKLGCQTLFAAGLLSVICNRHKKLKKKHEKKRKLKIIKKNK